MAFSPMSFAGPGDARRNPRRVASDRLASLLARPLLDYPGIVIGGHSSAWPPLWIQPAFMASLSGTGASSSSAHGSP